MSASGRHYHGLDHLADLWVQHRRLSRGGRFAKPAAKRLIAAAIVYHDAIYDPRRSDNETASAALWRRHAGLAARLPRRDIAQVAEAIEATGRHAAGELANGHCNAITHWLLDLDLVSIGAAYYRFQSNTAGLRAESDFIPARDWQRQSKKFLSALAQRKQLFYSLRISRAFETVARVNLAQALRTRG